MSKALRGVRSFIELLLSTTSFQARALLETASSKQVIAIREILTNILKPSFKVNSQARILIERRQRVLKLILKKQHPAQIIANHSRLLLHTLLAVKDIILSQI